MKIEKNSKYFTEMREKNEDIRIVKSVPINLEKTYGKKATEKIRLVIKSSINR